MVPFFLLITLTPAVGGCCFVGENLPAAEPVYAPIWEPKLRLHEKAERYERSFKEHNRTPEGLVDYSRPKAGRGPDEPRYGRHADGPFHTGISLAVFSLKYAATRDPAALADVAKALEGLEMLERVTGKPGLFARYFSRDAPPFDPKRMHEEDGRRAAPPLGDYVWRGDVSKDQYAGASFGLGTCLAKVDDPAIRARAAALARRIAAMLERNGEEIIDVSTGERTKYGDLHAFYGPVRIGLNAAICLGLAKAAAADGGGDAYYRSLLARGYGGAVKSGILNKSIFTIRNHVNDNMAFLALYPLIQLEREEGGPRDDYVRGLEGEWGEIADELNPFFNAIYAACGGKGAEDALRDARASLRLFPDEKVGLPVDYTRRPELDLGRRFFNTRKCKPRAARPLPLNMRPIGTMMWVADPDALCGNEGERDEIWLSPLDYLEAYWLARAHGLVRPED